MKFKSSFYFIFITILAVTACTKSSTTAPVTKPTNPTSPTDTAVNVYIGGSVSNGSKIIPAYWKNGVIVPLLDTLTSMQAAVSSIAVSGTDVYSAGYVITDNNNVHISDAVYWKNITPVILATNAELFGIAVNGPDVYTVGITFGDKARATYWKNGVATMLTDSATNSEATCILINGNDIYIGGYIEKNAAYWKNGVAVTLPSSYSNLQVSSMAVNGNNLYMVGYTTYMTAGIYWKNGVGTNVDTSAAVYYSGIVSQGSDLYIAGVTKNTANVTSGHYWKNGVMQPLADNVVGVGVTGIAVNGKNVYAIGYDQVSGVYWQNGTIVPIANENENAYLCIAVAPQ